MCDDAPEQPGRCSVSLTDAVRAGLIPMVVIVFFLPGPTIAQPGVDVSDLSPISLHPDVPTIVQLPDKIEHTWVFHGGEFKVQGMGDKLYLRPRRGTRAGVEGLVEVKTGTLHQVFWLRVVKRAKDAQREVVVPPVAAVECAEPAAPAVEPAASASASTPGPSVERAAPAPAGPEGGVTTEPERTAAADAEREATADGERDSDAAGSPRFEVSVHAVAALAGTTELAVAGYEPADARQPHRAFGVRFAVARPDAWWAVEASVGGEWLAAPTVHGNGRDDPARTDVVVVSGPLLRADAGIRARLEARFSPTAYAGIGLQAHHRDIEYTTKRPIDEPSTQDDTTRDMPFRGVLALGMGLEHQVGNLFLGLELHVRQGVPADYRSVAALLSVGFVLDQGE